MDFYQNWWKDWTWAKKEGVQFCGRHGQRGGITFLLCGFIRVAMGHGGGVHSTRKCLSSFRSVLANDLNSLGLGISPCSH